MRPQFAHFPLTRKPQTGPQRDDLLLLGNLHHLLRALPLGAQEFERLRLLATRHVLLGGNALRHASTADEQRLVDARPELQVLLSHIVLPATRLPPPGALLCHEHCLTSEAGSLDGLALEARLLRRRPRVALVLEARARPDSFDRPMLLWQARSTAMAR